MKAAAANVATRPAERSVVLLPSAYKSTWKKTPKNPEMVGLRLVGFDEQSRARAHASAEGWRLHPVPDDVIQRNDAAWDAFCCFVVARGTCMPKNVEAPFFTAAEDNVPNMLRGSAVRYLYDAIDELSVEMSPIRKEATADDLVELAARLTTGGASSGVIDKLDVGERVRAKKFLRYVLDALRTKDPTPEE